MSRLTGMAKGRIATLRKHRGLLPGLLIVSAVAIALPASAPALADATRFETAFVATDLAKPAPAFIPAPAPSVIAPDVTAPGDVAEEPGYKVIGTGMASYYGRELAGNRTASGERFDPAGLTAAHRTLPLGSKVRVTNRANGESVVVRINDRGPFHGNRVIDLSHAAASEIGLVRRGKGMVEIAVLDDNAQDSATD